MTCNLLEACVADQWRGMRRNRWVAITVTTRVSTYARITITIVYQRGVIMVFCYFFHVVRASINVWFC